MFLKVWSLMNNPQLDCTGFTITSAAAQKSGAKNGKQHFINLKRSSKCFWRTVTNVASIVEENINIWRRKKKLFYVRVVIYNKVKQFKIIFRDLNLDGNEHLSKITGRIISYVCIDNSLLCMSVCICKMWSVNLS